MGGGGASGPPTQRTSGNAAAITDVFEQGTPDSERLHVAGESLFLSQARGLWGNWVGVKTRALSVADADEALRYYSRAFGATALSRSSSDGGVVIRATLAIDGSTLVLREPATADGQGAANPGMALHLLLAADAAPIWDAALAAGAEAWSNLDAVADEVSGILCDPVGHVWMIAARRPSISELEAAAASMRACWEPDLPESQNPTAARARAPGENPGS